MVSGGAVQSHCDTMQVFTVTSVNYFITRHYWVVGDRGTHDDIESLERAISERAKSASEAWKIFLKLHGSKSSYKV